MSDEAESGISSSPSEQKPKRPRPKRFKSGEKDARAALVLQARLTNKRTEEIQKDFAMSKATVYRALNHAKRIGLMEKARDYLGLTLVPLALAAYEEALTQGDLPLKVDVATRVLDGLGITGKFAVLTFQGIEGKNEQSFDEFRATVTRRIGRAGTLGPGRDGEAEPPTIEAAAVSGRLQSIDGEVSLPPSEGEAGVVEGAGETGLSEPDGRDDLPGRDGDE